MIENNGIKETVFLILLISVILGFLFPLVTMDKLFIGGDNFVQFYPWFKTYSESIKKFEFPFWTRYMQGGFPLMAEGQVGGYYPLNLLFFTILPFNLAYNYSIIFHFLLGGIAVYFLIRKLGGCEKGSFVGALIFCFGSAYAGCFYNIITLRALSWTPLVFLLFEYYFERKRVKYLLIAGLIFGFQLLAGFVQVALYAALFYLLYFIYKTKLLKGNINRSLISFLIFCIPAGIVFLPQFILTAKLALYSFRSNSDMTFALWGSFNPLAVTGTVFPNWPIFSDRNFYLTIFGLLFLITSFYLLKREKGIRPIFLVFLISFLFAMGKYNPLYPFIIKIANLYALRNPYKFLFFTALASSVLIGKGFSAFFSTNFDNREKAVKTFLIFLLTCLIFFCAMRILLFVFNDQIISIGKWYAAKFVYGHPSHRYELSVYLTKAEDILSGIVKSTSFSNTFNIVALIFIAIAIVIFRIGSWHKVAKANASQNIIICLIIVDLAVYSLIGSGFRGNICSTSRLNPDNQKILNYIKSDQSLFRVLPYNIASGELPNWSIPNANITYGIDSIAGYTPLANEYYRAGLKELEIVDNSLGLLSPSKDSLHRNLSLIRILNVKYIISPEELDKSYLNLIMRDGKTRLYELKDGLPRAFVAKKIDPDKIDSDINVFNLSYSSGKAAWKVDMPYEGYLIFSENKYPGWRVLVDGEKSDIEPFLLVQAVKLEKGQHEVKFVYDPYRFDKK